MKKISIFILMGILLLIAQNLFAVPAVPWPVEKELPDGTIVSVYIRGDEKVHWMESLDGYTLLYNDSQTIVYAMKNADGDLVPSAVHYGKAGLSAEEARFVSELDKGLRYSSAQVSILKQIWEIEDSAVSKSKPAKVNVIGDKKALCILTNFSDRSMRKTKEQFENMMNQVGFVNENGMVGSVKDFYRENSYNKMDLTITVVGPYTLTNTTSYYATRQSQFAGEAIRLADADVDYSELADGKTNVETVHIVFAGYGDESIGNGQQIWSHKSSIPAVLLDGVWVSDYSCSPELRGRSGNTLSNIGVICHELCHVFGAADYYDTDYEGSGAYFPTTGNWDLMSGGSWNSNGDSPAHINMFQKILFGWVEPIELTEPTTITNMPNSTENPVAYIIKPYTNNEQYVLENRQKIGFDKYVPGSGLLIYHIHHSASTGNVDNTTHPQQAYVVSAASTTAIPNSDISSYGSVNSEKAPFGSVIGLNKFAKETVPAMFRWDNAKGTTADVPDKSLTNITQSGGLISFDFYKGYSPAADATLINLAVSQGKLTPEFNSGTATYTVTVDNAVETIDVTGAPSGAKASVAGNVTDKALAVGDNTVTITVTAEDKVNTKTYTVTVKRNAAGCGSYESKPAFKGDVVADSGDEKLNLNMGPAVPYEVRSSFTVKLIDIDALFARESENDPYTCAEGWFDSTGVEKIRVSQTGTYYISSSTPFSIFDTMESSCERFVASNAYFTDTSLDWSPFGYTVALNANKDYYFRTYFDQGTVSFDIGPGVVYAEYDIPSGMSYTYIAVDQSDNKIKMQSATADFRSLTEGTYRIYGVPYSTAGNTNPATFVGKTIDEVSNSDCIIPSSTFITITVSGGSGIITDKLDTQSLTVYTNRGYIHTLSDGTDTIHEVNVYNLDGVQVYRSAVNAISHTTNKSFGTGIYLVQVKTDKGTTHKKIIVNR